VDYSCVVDGLESLGTLQEDVEELRPVERLVIPQHLPQGLPLHQLHRTEDDVAVFAVLVHGANVWVLDLPGELDLGVKPSHRFRVTPQVHDLERHHGVEGPVTSLEDRTHATFAKVGQDFVATGDEGADGRG
jgi:hypothetical protein